MLKREEEEIDGMRFTVVQFPAMYGFNLLARLAKTIGPAMTALSGVSAETDLSTLGPSFREALSSLDPDEAQRLVLELLKSTSVLVPDVTGGRRVEFTDRAKIDEVFSGRLTTMFKVLGFSLRVNFSDFVAGRGLPVKAPPVVVHSA